MPPITKHQSAQTTKLLLIGDSGSGKTGSLASLASAGYRLRIIDLDNGLDVLKSYLTNPSSPYLKINPQAAENVQFVTLTEKMRHLNGKIYATTGNVWQKAIEKIVHWKEPTVDGIPAVDLGPVATWGPQDVLVIDSLSFLSTAALNFHLAMNGALGKERSGYEGQRDIGAAQGLLRSFLEMIFDEGLKCNVVLTSHITLVSEMGGGPKDKEGNQLPSQGYPSAIGRALSPHIPRYFNTVLFVKTYGVGSMTKHKIYTTNQGVVNVKSSAPLSVAPEYDISQGLAQYFKAVRDNAVVPTKETP